MPSRLTTQSRSTKGIAWVHRINGRSEAQGLIILHGRVHGSEMKTRTYCVYNLTRECFLSLGVMPADTPFTRLKGLIGKLKLRVDEGLWVVPSCGIHTVGVLFPLDLIYLDENHHVIHVIEHFPRFSISPLKPRASSVLELPTHTIFSSQTQPGDQLIICAVEEIANQFRKEKDNVTQFTSPAQRFGSEVAFKERAQEANFLEGSKSK